MLEKDFDVLKKLGIFLCKGGETMRVKVRSV